MAGHEGGLTLKGLRCNGDMERERKSRKIYVTESRGKQRGREETKNVDAKDNIIKG